MATTNGINANESYFDRNTAISIEYDFNKDGVVDVNDYQFAKLTLADEDPSNDVDLSLTELDTIFKSLLTDTDNTKYYDMAADELNNDAEKLIEDIDNIEDPANATSLLDLQNIGKKLTARIKVYSNMATALGNKISNIKSELDALQEEKDIKEAEYIAKTEEVDEKSRELARNIDETLDYSQKITDEKSKKCDELVDEAIKEYIDGKHPNMSLQAIIMNKLSTVNNAAELANLQSMIDNNEGVGETINALCSDIDALVSDIKDVTDRYNSKTTEYNRTVNNRNSIISAAQQASVNYQSGYQKRIDMRNELIKRYSAQGGGLTDDNPQIQSLSSFLANGELNRMTFEDAWVILSSTFNGISGLSFNADYSVSIPYGHSDFQKGVFDSLAAALNSTNVGRQTNESSNGSSLSSSTSSPFDDINITATCNGYEDSSGPKCVTGTTRNDPISFNKDGVNYDFVIDRNNDGIFNDVSEFLGAKNGWAEMKNYDKDGDGHISGDELNDLKLVGTDQTDGKFLFLTAAEAGIADINLNSYKGTRKILNNNDLLAGTFSLTTNDGEVIHGDHTYDTVQNTNNKYGFLYGSSIENAANMYEENPFMAEFKETLDTKATVDDTQADISLCTTDAEATVRAGERKDKRTENDGLVRGRIQKDRADEAEEREEAKAEEEEDNKKLNIFL